MFERFYMHQNFFDVPKFEFIRLVSFRHLFHYNAVRYITATSVHTSVCCYQLIVKLSRSLQEFWAAILPQFIYISTIVFLDAFEAPSNGRVARKLIYIPNLLMVPLLDLSTSYCNNDTHMFDFKLESDVKSATTYLIFNYCLIQLYTGYVGDTYKMMRKN